MAAERDACREALPLLVDGASELGIELEDHARDVFVQYCAMLLETNAHMNLTALRTPEQVMHGLFLDSLTVTLALPEEWIAAPPPLRLMDVGTGAGVPGMPLQIVFPMWRAAFIESVGKKAAFVERVASVLGFMQVGVLSRRAEEVGCQPAWRDRADLTVARAVAALPTLVELCAPLTREGGLLVFAKSGDIEAEVAAAAAAAQAVGCRFERIVWIPEELGFGPGRAQVVYRKFGSTPAGFPRRVGLAKTRPVGGGGAAG